MSGRGLLAAGLRRLQTAPSPRPTVTLQRHWPAPRGLATDTTRPAMFNKILIANRGEIACRVMRSARKNAVKTVAVFSDPDANSLHVQMADEAYRIGPAASAESYLKMHDIIQLAKDTGAQAIHPGYGFLSENAEFAKLCEKEGVEFIGPPASAIRDMGSKSESKNIMDASNVPVVKGYHGEDQSDDLLFSEAQKIGFPVLIKAVKGGGGKGMRIVEEAKGFQEALESARRESLKSFADDRVLVEKYVQRPRHVEVQVFADKFGNCVYLYERDCSVQRRHQKIIEEAPAPGLSMEKRKELGEAAVRAAKAVNYVGAGTVEFIVDTKTMEFYFMEMNTRLQVEHPISEMITGTDLVELQLQAASGFPLALTQDDISINGHAFEARIYAENPRSNFLPGAGPLRFMRTPAEDSTVRVETGVRQGDEVSVHYDPMIAKLVVWDEDRDTALAKLRAKLRAYNIAGLSTNINFLGDLASHPEFVEANVTTDFIDDFYDDLFPEQAQRVETLATAALVVLQGRQGASASSDPWSSAAFKRLNTPFQTTLIFNDGTSASVRAAVDGSGFDVEALGKTVKVSGGAVGDAALEVRIGDAVRKYTFCVLDRTVHLFSKEYGHEEVELAEPAFLSALNVSAGSNAVVAPMTGKIEKVMVKVGDTVELDQPLVVMEAMKMEMVLKAPRSGVVARVELQAGDLVAQEAVIVELEEEVKAAEASS